jgi:eukaryotic-like serine/threonine-protein kinase
MPGSYGWSDVKHILVDALELPPHERADFLEHACPDPLLRADVERLLRAHERAAGSSTFLDVPAAEFAAPLIVEVDEHEHAGPASLRAALAGRYVIERQLGHGGMGAVYLARDERHGRPVALKVVHAAAALENGPSFGAHRFQREIEFAARLNHPHILTLHDSGAVDGFLYYVMPYVDGESLRDLLARTGPQPMDVTLRVLRDVTRALTYAHRRGVAHRDIKPGNILLNQDGDALVSDFGIAKALAAAAGPASAARDPEVTTPGLVLGTAAYIAPEQVTGDPNTDHRADLYALGVVAYEMLTGSTPFAGLPAHKMLAAHLSEVPQAVAMRRPEAPSALTTLVTQLLAKNPADRPGDAGAVLETLNAILHQPTIAGTTPRERRSNPVRLLAATGAGLLLLLIALFAFPWRREAAIIDRSIAVLPFVNTNGRADDEPFSDGLTDELISALSSVPGLQVAGRTSTFALKGRGLTVRAIADSLGVTTVLEGSVRRDGEQLKVTVQLVDTRDDRVLWSRTYDRAFRDVFAVQERLARDIVSALSVRLEQNGMPARLVERGTEDLEAYQLYLKGRFLYNTRQRDGLLQARTYFEQAVMRDPAYARAHAGLANVYNNLAVFGYARPVDAFPKARIAALRALALDSSLVEAHAALAHQLFVYDWDWKAAETAFQRAIALDPDYQGARNLYSMYLHATGRHEEALEQLRVARSLDPLVPTGPLAGRIYVNTQQPDAAIRELREALELNPQLDLAHQLLGHAFLQKGMHSEAIASLQRAAELSGARDSAQLAYMYAAIGQPLAARLILHQLLDTRAERYLPPFHVAMAYAGLGDADEAFRWLDAAFEQRASFMEGLAVSMGFDAIRSDPRFAVLLRRMNLH